MKFLIIVALILAPLFSEAQTKEVIIPKHNDLYSVFVETIERGDTGINYGEFRNAFQQSKQYKIKQEKRSQYDSLKKVVIKGISTEDYDAIILAGKSMLDIDYTSLFAHKYLFQAYRINGDKRNEKKHEAIQLGLLQSILKSGDGRTCETGWKVVQVEEEYFLIYALGSQFIKQKTVTAGTISCDEMRITDKYNKEESYFFNISSFYPPKN